MNIESFIKSMQRAYQTGANEEDYKKWKLGEIASCGNDPLLANCDLFEVYLGEREYIYMTRNI